MVLYKATKEIKLDKLPKRFVTILTHRETQWNVLQQKELKKGQKGKLKKKLESKDYTKRLLQNRKSWGGPYTTVEKLQQILKEKFDQEVHIKNEFPYQAYTHKPDKMTRPVMFRLNGISHEEKLTN